MKRIVKPLKICEFTIFSFFLIYSFFRDGVFFGFCPPHISIDPPENTTISNTTIEIVEDSLMQKISCHGNGYPKLQYQWIRNGTVIRDGANLQLYNKMKREDAGSYECVSRNKHGTQIVAMNVSILCMCILNL